MLLPRKHGAHLLHAETFHQNTKRFSRSCGVFSLLSVTTSSSVPSPPPSLSPSSFYFPVLSPRRSASFHHGSSNTVGRRGRWPNAPTRLPPPRANANTRFPILRLRPSLLRQRTLAAPSPGCSPLLRPPLVGLGRCRGLSRLDCPAVPPPATWSVRRAGGRAVRISHANLISALMIESCRNLPALPAETDELVYY